MFSTEKILCLIKDTRESPQFDWLYLKDKSKSLGKNMFIVQVAKFASSMVAPISYNIYGDVYDVKVEPNPYNIANDNGPLPFHMDLVYYEAPPGLQFIHCIKFDESIKGGESLLVDSFDGTCLFSHLFSNSFVML